MGSSPPSAIGILIKLINKLKGRRDIIAILVIKIALIIVKCEYMNIFIRILLDLPSFLPLTVTYVSSEGP
jgi:hypothetical protein